MSMSHEGPLHRVRRICLGLPEATERMSHGSPAWFVRKAPQFAAWVDDHHGDGRVGFWCAAAEGVQAELVGAEPERFFRPPYVGGRGWLGVDVTVDPDWDELAAILTDAYRTVAPAALRARLDASTAH